MATSIGLGGLSRRLVQIADFARDNANRIVRETALVGDQVFVLNTPVDEGRARASTIVSIGTPATQEVEPPVLGDGGASAALALAQGQAAVSAYDVTTGETIFITQTTDYSVFLDQGSSAQAPNGMTKPAADAMQEFLRRRARPLRGV